MDTAIDNILSALNAEDIVEKYVTDDVLLIAAKSSVPGAGNGLFTMTSLKHGQLLGEYTGNSVSFQQVT